MEVIENRYGSRVLPDDDAGRSDLFELLLVISLGERPAMQNTIETAAPWLSAEEAESMVAHITVALDRHERWCSPRVLGNRLNLRDRERQQDGIRHIRPIDVSDEELIDRRKAKARTRDANGGSRVAVDRVRITLPTLEAGRSLGSLKV